MQIFYTPDIAIKPELPEEEAGHCIRVLRLGEGDEIVLTDGQGSFYKAAISRAHPKHCEVTLLESWKQPDLWNFNLHIAIAPTKNMDRMEWFVEKATEIGINAITCLNCRFSERDQADSIGEDIGQCHEAIPESDFAGVRRNDRFQEVCRHSL